MDRGQQQRVSHVHAIAFSHFSTFYTSDIPPVSGHTSLSRVAIPLLLVLARLDYCNNLLINLPASLIQRLQSVQNAAARLIFNMRRSKHITDALFSLHWLRVPERIVFKVAMLTFRSLHGTAPPYLTSQFTRVADMPNRRRL